LPGHTREKAFDGVRRGEVFRRAFNDGCVSGVLGEFVEVRQVATGTVEEEAHDLLEGFFNRQPLGILSDGGEETGKVRIYADSTEIAGK